MRTVVTGGAGFIGSNLVQRLREQNREVVIADDLSRGIRLNLLDLGIPPDFPCVDLRDYNQTLRITEKADTVFHLAARIGSIEYLHGTDLNELEALQTNLVIDANVFKACVENHVKKLVYASSAAVYPIDLQQAPNVTLSETNLNYFKPDGGYGWAKLIGEIQLGWMKGIEIGVARIFNVYGQNSSVNDNTHVIIDLLKKATYYPREKFVVWGDGQQSRDFLHVSDCVSALLRIEEKARQPLIIANIGSGVGTNISAIVKEISVITGKSLKVNYDLTKPVGPLSRTADIGRARDLLEWEPKTKLDEGLKLTYDWLQKRLTEVGGHHRLGSAYDGE
jgi:nucleoside-diphosphate-sugar epimerase